MSKNKSILSYAKLSTGIINKYANTTSHGRLYINNRSLWIIFLVIDLWI